MRPGPGLPRSIGRRGGGACIARSQDRQTTLGRTCRITRKDAGTYSSTSVMSSPRFRTSPAPQSGHVEGGAWTIASRGRWGGNGWRAGRLGFPLEAVGTAPSSSAAASSASHSPSASSS